MVTTMAVSRHCILFLVNAATVLLSGCRVFWFTNGMSAISETTHNFKYVCLGDTVPMFQILDFHPCNVSISLIINGKKNKLIATWSYKHCIQNPYVSIEYTDRLFLDDSGTITIHNINYFDQGQYFISKNETFPPIQEVNIQIPVAPSNSCKPIIQHLGNKLFASVKHEDCGRPVVTPYWKRDDGSSDSHEHIQTIAEGIESGLYTACIEGPALKCEQNLMQRNQCSSIIISRNTNGTESTAPSSSKYLIFLITCTLSANCCLLMVSFFIVVQIQAKSRYTCRSPTTNEDDLVQTDLATFFESTTINEDDHVHTYLDKLEWEDILNMLNSDQQQGLQRYCKNFKSPTINEDDLVHTYLDRLSGMDIKELLNPVQRKDLERHFSKSICHLEIKNEALMKTCLESEC